MSASETSARGAKAQTYEAVALPPRLHRTDAEIVAAAEANLAALRTRRSVRDFSDRAVSREVIEAAVAAAHSAPSGANHQPWHFVAIADPAAKARIRAAAEDEERAFYAGGGGDAWLRALEPIGTGPDKPHLTVAPWLIVIFAQRYKVGADGARAKNYYVPESVGIATGFLIQALHACGLASLTHTPNPMGFLNELCARPPNEKPSMILAVGHPADGATHPRAAAARRPLGEVLTVL